MHPNTPAHLVYKEPLVPGDIVRLPVQFSQGGKISELRKHPSLIIDRIRTNHGPMNRVVLGLGLNSDRFEAEEGDIVVSDPKHLIASGLSEPVFFRPHINVLIDPDSPVFSGDNWIGHLAPQFGAQLAEAQAALAQDRESFERHLAASRRAAGHHAHRR